MTNSTRATGRISKEISRMNADPPRGIYMWIKDDNITQLEAIIEGPEGSPYEKGEFRLEISIPDGYPNIPPVIKFKTRVYHPNIDKNGRICLDSLKPEPQGTWKPSLNLESVLTQIRILLSEPNKDDPLDMEIAQQMTQFPELYKKKAREMTEMFAKPLHDTPNEEKSQSRVSSEEEENVE